MTENQQLFLLVIVVAIMGIGGLIYRAQLNNAKRHEQEKQTSLLEQIAAQPNDQGPTEVGPRHLHDPEAPGSKGTPKTPQL